MKTFVEFEDPYADLSEISQQGTLKFAFAKKLAEDKYETQHIFVKCRDFLNDAVIGTHGAYETPEIYGFTFNGEDDPIDRDKTRMILSMKTEQEFKNFKHNLPKLNNMFANAKMERTRAWKIMKGDTKFAEGTDEDDYNDIPSMVGVGYLLVEGDSKWSDHPTAMSFYSLMLRVSTTSRIAEDISFAKHLRNEDAHSGNDREYLREFNRAFPHPSDFIKVMGLLDMDDIHSSIRDENEMESAHERGGIKIFSCLINAARKGQDFIEDYIYDECGDEYDADYAYRIFPTLPSAIGIVS